MSRRTLVLGVDAGGSRTRCVLLDAEGRTRGRGEAGRANPRSTSPAAAASAVRDAIAATLAAAGADRHDLRAVGIGWSGLEAPGTEADARRLLGEAFPEEADVVLDTDVYAAHVGAFAGGPGVLLVAGTGSIALAVDAAGRRSRVGGWGHRYGDEGSAVWITTEAVKRALRTVDGRDTAGRLWQALAAFVGVSHGDDPEPSSATLTGWLYAPEREISDVARFAARVHVLARQGDEASRTVLREAGRHLAELATAAAGRLSTAPPHRIACTGGVWQNNEVVRAAFEAALAERGSSFDVREPLAPPEVGAAWMATGAPARVA